MTEDIEHAYLKEKMHYQHDSGLYETELRAHGRDGQSGRWGRVWGGDSLQRVCALDSGVWLNSWLCDLLGLLPSLSHLVSPSLSFPIGVVGRMTVSLMNCCEMKPGKEYLKSEKRLAIGIVGP